MLDNKDTSDCGQVCIMAKNTMLKQEILGRKLKAIFSGLGGCKKGTSLTDNNQPNI